MLYFLKRAGRCPIPFAKRRAGGLPPTLFDNRITAAKISAQPAPPFHVFTFAPLHAGPSYNQHDHLGVARKNAMITFDFQPKNAGSAFKVSNENYKTWTP